MNTSETVAFWNTKKMDAKKYATFFNERFLNEIRFFSNTKSELYNIVFKIDEDLANKQDIARAEKCICEMNACLRSAHELYLHGQEQNFDFRDAYVVTAFNFVKQYEKGKYDTQYDELCYYFKEKILKSTEL